MRTLSVHLRDVLLLLLSRFCAWIFFYFKRDFIAWADYIDLDWLYRLPLWKYFLKKMDQHQSKNAISMWCFNVQRLFSNVFFENHFSRRKTVVRSCIRLSSAFNLGKQFSCMATFLNRLYVYLLTNPRSTI